MKENINKRVPKTSPKFHLSLSEDQKLAKSKILNSKVAVVIGKPGTGKTLLCTQIALDQLFTRQINRIKITRPTVKSIDSEDIGHLPGQIEEKYAPWVAPIVDNMKKLYGKEKIESIFEEGLIEIIPIQFMRGITIDTEILIVDECENLTEAQILLILTRIGLNSKILFCGDFEQCDFKDSNKSGMLKLIKVANSLPYMEVIELTTNHRDPIVEEILNSFKK